MSNVTHSLAHTLRGFAVVRQRLISSVGWLALIALALAADRMARHWHRGETIDCVAFAAADVTLDRIAYTSAALVGVAALASLWRRQRQPAVILALAAALLAFVPFHHSLSDNALDPYYYGCLAPPVEKRDTAPPLYFR